MPATNLQDPPKEAPETPEASDDADALPVIEALPAREDGRSPYDPSLLTPETFGATPPVADPEKQETPDAGDAPEAPEKPEAPDPSKTPETPEAPKKNNFAALREAKEAAEKELAEVKARLSELEPQSKTWEVERTRLAQVEKDLAEAQKASFRASAHETPEFKKLSGYIETAKTKIGTILGAVEEMGVTAEQVLSGDSKAMNAALRSLQDEGLLVEAGELPRLVNAVKAWKMDANEIVEKSAQEREAWKTSRDTQAVGAVRQARESLAAKNPLWNPTSAERAKLPPEQSKWYDEQMAKAEAVAVQAASLADSPSALVEAAFGQALAFEVVSANASHHQAQATALAQENADLKAKLKAYESATAEPEIGGGGGSSAPPETSYDPSKMSGYKGML